MVGSNGHRWDGSSLNRVQHPLQGCRGAGNDGGDGTSQGAAKTLWTLDNGPDGTRVLVVPAHRVYAEGMNEETSLAEERSDRLKAALCEMDARVRHAAH